MEAQGGRLLTIREAAGALGVSAETLRRWAEAGRITAERTVGGHRRFRPAEVQRLKGSVQVEFRPTGPPTGPLPSLDLLLQREAGRLLEATAKRLYAGSASGWFDAPETREEREAWMAKLALAAESGNWGPALVRTQQLLELARLSGASLLERHSFLETLAALVVRELSATASDQDELNRARRVFLALRHRLLYDAEAQPIAAASSGPDAIRDLFAGLLELPDVDWVALYESDAESLELHLRVHAASEGVGPAVPASCRLGSGPVGRVALSRQAAIEDDASKGVSPMALVPAVAGEESTGVLVLGLRRARAVGDHELRLLEALGGAVARVQRGGPTAADALPRALGTFRAAWAGPAGARRAV
jgi:excisionase family DNA binding protein